MRPIIKVKVPRTLFDDTKAKVKRATKRALAAATEYAKDRILSEANRRLGPEQARQYNEGLQDAKSLEVKDNSAIIRLIGNIPESIEKGFTSFSIASKMLAKAKKVTKDGRPYVDVPFDHGTSARGSVPGSFSKPVAREALAAVAGAGARRANRKPMRINISNQADRPRVVQKTLHPSGRTLTVKHKTGIYHNLIRNPIKNTAKAKFLTIRRISSNSSPTAWIHPGSLGVNIFRDLSSEIKAVVGVIINDIFSEELGRG